MDTILLLEKIIDFTELLKDYDNYIYFNPCITYYKEDLYLCSCRVLSKNHRILKEYEKNPYYNPNHPWKHKWFSIHVDDEINKNDIIVNYTKFLMLKINKSCDYKIKLVKNYKEMFNDFYGKKPIVFPEDIPNDETRAKIQEVYTYNIFENLIDIRIHKTPIEGLFILTGNKVEFNKNFDSMRINQHQISNNTNNYKCSSDNICIFMYSCVIRINSSSLKIEFLTEPSIICSNLSGKIERNWSLICDKIINNKYLEIIVTYQLTEKNYGHEIFKTLYDLEHNIFNDKCEHYSLLLGSTINDTKIHPTNLLNRIQGKKLSFYKIIEDAFNINGEKNLFISSGSPYIEYSKYELLSVGHLKFKYRNIATSNKFTVLNNFLQKCTADVINYHYTYVYMFFIYVINRNDYSLSKISKFYIPSPADVSLIFPVGIDKIQDDYILSYGNYDSTCEALFFTRSSLDNALFDISEITKYINIDTNGDINNKDEVENIVRNMDLFSFTRWKKGINKIIIK